jgi:hypothetical protein
MTMSTGTFFYICWNDGEAGSIFVFPLLNSPSFNGSPSGLLIVHSAHDKAIRCCHFCL